MVDDPDDPLFSYLSLSDPGMTVLVASQTKNTVIQMDCFQPGKTNRLVEFVQNAIQIIDYIIATIKNMTGIQADTHLFLKFHPVQKFPKFLKTSSYFAALSGHSFQQHCSILLRP